MASQRIAVMPSSQGWLTMSLRYCALVADGGASRQLLSTA
jgi:hypothetical protein